MTVFIHEPKVIKPEGFDAEAVWADCREAMNHLEHADGSPNWKALASADPGICACPVCEADHWNLGDVQECVMCGFQYPTDWWPMYSWGSQAGKNEGAGFRRSSLHDKRMSHPYYRHGYENPVDDPWKERHKQEWRIIMGQNT